MRPFLDLLVSTCSSGDAADSGSAPAPLSTITAVPVPAPPPSGCLASSTAGPLGASTLHLLHRPRRKFLRVVSSWICFRATLHPSPLPLPKLRCNHFSPVDVLATPSTDILCDATFARPRELCASGLVGVAFAAPPCSFFSRARLRPGGLPPVRSVACPCGLPNLSPSGQAELARSGLLHSRTRELLSLVAASGGVIVMENPTSSLLWLGPQVVSRLKHFAPFAASVSACQRGLDLRKQWLFCSKSDRILQVASSCPHPPGTHPAISGLRLPDGSFRTGLSAQYPASLAALLAKHLHHGLGLDSCSLPWPDWPSGKTLSRRCVVSGPNVFWLRASLQASSLV